MTFCAICCSDRGPFTTETLGKGNAPVAVCNACSTEPPSAWDSDRGYTAPELEVSFYKAVAESYRRVVQTHNKFDPQRAVVSASTDRGIRTANMRLVRVPIRGENGKPRDAREARAAAGDKLHPEARCLGSTSTQRHHVFEQPDPDFVRKSREPERDVIGDLARLGRTSR